MDQNCFPQPTLPVERVAPKPDEFEVMTVDGPISCLATFPKRPPSDARSALPPVLLLAHGAGGHIHHESVQDLAQGLSDRGIIVVRFNFLFAEKRLAKGTSFGPTGSMLKLGACFHQVTKAVKDRFHFSVAKRKENLDIPGNDSWNEFIPPKTPNVAPISLYLGGRSLGARAACTVAGGVDGAPLECKGVVCFAYPMHPPHKPGKARGEPLRALTKQKVPGLFVSGTRDPMMTRHLWEANTDAVLHEFEEVLDGDHSFKVLKRTAKTAKMVTNEICKRVALWVFEQEKGKAMMKATEFWKKRKGGEGDGKGGKRLKVVG